MYGLLPIAIDTLLAGVFLVPAVALFEAVRRKETGPAHRTAVVLFALYLAAVFSAVGFPFVRYLTVDVTVNLVPFVGMRGGIGATVLNVFLFMPLGAFLPVIWRSFRSAGKTALFGFLLSFLIEVSQIFTYRASDVDDLITNTAGTLIGYGILHLANRMAGGRLYLKDERGGLRELLAVCGVAILVAFFLSPFLSGALWQLLL